MANEFVVIYDDVKSWFSKVFKNAPAETTIALSVLNTAVPLLEATLAVADPAAAAIVDPIASVVQADLGTVAGMLQKNNITGIGSFLAAIKANFSTLLAEAHITDQNSVNKANAFLSVIQSVATALGVTV